MNVFRILIMIATVGIGWSMALSGCAKEKSSTPELEPEITAHLNFEETIEEEGSTFAPKRMLDIQVSITDANWNKLRFEHRDPVVFFGSGCREPIPNVFNYYPADVTLDGESIGQVGVRTKGLVGSINPARPSLKIKLQEYQDDLFYKEHKRFTLNNQSTDAARLSACMAYYIFRKMGVPASRCNFAHVHVNENDMGVYANVEPIKKPMLKRLFGDDSGNLYEGTVSDIRTGFDMRIEKKTNEAENDWSDVERLKAAIESPDDEFIDRIRKVINIDAFLTFTAASVMVGHWDSFSGNRNNYYFYHDPTSDKFFFIPWGADDTFSNQNIVSGGAIQAAMGGALLARRLLEDPGIMTQYRDTMRRLLEERWVDEEILGELNRMEAMLSSHITESNEGFSNAVKSAREYISTRKQNLLNAVTIEPIPFSEPLEEEPVCLQVSGRLNISFEGVWGTLGAENPFNNGSGIMSATYGEFNFASETVASMMGEVGSPGASEIDFLAVVDGEYVIFYRLMLPTEAIQPNNSLDMSDPRVSALMVRVELATRAPQVMGFLGDGTFTFGDEVDLTPGGTVAGELSATIWGGFAEAYGSPGAQ